MAAKAKKIDWAAVELLYRAGIRSLKSIGDEFGVSDAGIIKRAKKYGWTRDLGARIREKAEVLVNAAAVSPEARAQKEATEEETVAAGATLQANTILAHQKDVSELRRIVMGMAGELKALSNKELQAALEQVLDERCDKQSQQYITALNKAFDAALALGGRSAAGKNLVASLSILIEKDRQAVGIDKDGGSRQSLGEWLNTLT